MLTFRLFYFKVSENMKSTSRQKYLDKQKEKHNEYVKNKKKEYQIKQIKEYPVKKECELLEFLLENIKGQSRNNIKNLHWKTALMFPTFFKSVWN